MRIALALMLCAGPAVACPGLTVEDGWIREPPPQAEVVAAFMTVHNVGAIDVVVTRITGPLFGGSMLHETTTSGDQMHMTMLPSVTIAAGTARTFKPGGLHVMLMQPATSLAQGNTIPLEMTCANGSLKFELTVKRD